MKRSQAIFVFLVLSKLAFGLGNEIILLKKAQSLGTLLHFSCVLNPPDEKRIPKCMALKKIYYNYLIILSRVDEKIILAKPKMRNYTKLLQTKDPYGYSPFSVCEYELGHLILSEICAQNLHMQGG